MIWNKLNQIFTNFRLQMQALATPVPKEPEKPEEKPAPAASPRTEVTPKAQEEDILSLLHNFA